MDPSSRALQLVTHAGDGIIVCDPAGTISFWNDGAERIFGFSRAEATGRMLDLIIPERQRRPHWAGYAEVMRTGVTRYGSELLRVPALHKDGRRISIAFTVTLLRGDAGNVEAIAAIIRDETQRWAEERALRERVAELAAGQESGREAVSAEESLTTAIARLRAHGYDAPLRVVGDAIEVQGRGFRAQDFAVVGVHRVEGASDPSDMAAIFALEGPDGVRGLLVDAFGPYGSAEVSAALRHMRRPPDGSWDAASHHPYRIEIDTLGEVAVPESCYWGAQTQRALAHFAIGSERMPLPLIHALGVVKSAVARANGELGELALEKSRAIAAAADEIAAGALDAQFPLRVWQTGSGTQTNMNANEVIANRASELLGGGRGEARRVHPNDDVNRSQSSNDVIPSAIHVAAALAIERQLRPALAQLRAALGSKREEFANVVKMGRTHLMDALPLTLGQEISGWQVQLDECDARLERAAVELMPLALGGSAVGTGFGTRAGFAELACARVAESTGLPFRSHPNKFAVLAAHDALVSASACLRTLAGALLKIANDVRWLASGPRGGLAEIALPENEPGSSIMPGKTNPTQAEALAMVCVQVFGNDAAVAFAGSQGSFELNVYKPLIARGLLDSLELLTDAIRSFTNYCVVGISARPERLREYVESSLMLATALVPRIGYDAAARIAHKAHAEGRSLRDVAIELGLVTAEEYDATVRPEAMLAPYGR